MKIIHAISTRLAARRSALPFTLTTGLLLATLLLPLAGCGTAQPGNEKREFFTSGDRQADQRARQEMSKAKQLAGSSENNAEKKAVNNEQLQSGQISTNAMLAPDKRTLYQRLGGETGISRIVADFIPRAMHDPRVNWERKDVGWHWFHHSKKPMWTPTTNNLAVLEKHMCQFIALATGGPSHYDGKDIKNVHQDMHITDNEFDATIGDLKASMDKLKIADREQKELLAIIESTRPQIVAQ